MNGNDRPAVLHIDSDRQELVRIAGILESAGFRTLSADSGKKGLEMAATEGPAVILLEIVMPEINGYTVCARLHEREETGYIPVIFMTTLREAQNKAKAFSLGAVDYLVKPVADEVLIERVRDHLQTHELWKGIREDRRGWHERIHSADFIHFKEYLSDRLRIDKDKRFTLSMVSPLKLYPTAVDLGINEKNVARLIAEFLKVPYLEYIDPEEIRLGVIPKPFSRSNHVVAMEGTSGGNRFLMSNPFNWDLIDTLMSFSDLTPKSELAVTEPANIRSLFEYVELKQSDGTRTVRPLTLTSRTRPPKTVITEQPIIEIANNIIESAVSERASDIHIEPKETDALVRFRVDGDLRDIFPLKKTTGMRLIARFKALGNLDIAEKKKPQDGSFVAVVDNRTFNLRISTISTPNGESIVMRLLEPYARPRELGDLGMTGRQEDTMISLANRPSGLILIVGPTGSGKTTTIYSTLHNIDYKTRSIMSVEDPVEYRIPFVNQQQVNEKAGITFEALLKSSVRQDPDVLFMGEVRDRVSANIALDFASTGHVTISTMHTSNATTAIFRLERLGVSRGIMADSIIAIVAQRLAKRLCARCREIVPISEEERSFLKPFTDDIPERVAHPVGCPKCNNTGYFGREGIYEIMEIDSSVADMIRTGAAISDIRRHLHRRGTYLLSSHAILKVRRFLLSPQDVYEDILLELIELTKGREEVPAERAPGGRPKEMSPSILLIGADEEARSAIAAEGYRVSAAGDGIDAIMSFGREHFDLIISNIAMSNLEGPKLLEILHQKDIDTPVIFLGPEGESMEEAACLDLGAAGCLFGETTSASLLARVRKTLAGRGGGRKENP